MKSTLAVSVALALVAALVMVMLGAAPGDLMLAGVAGAVQLPLQTRLAPVESVNKEARTAELIWSTGARVRRREWLDWDSYRDYWEELSLDPGHVRMGRLQSGAPLLNAHNRWSLEDQIGVVEAAALEAGRGVATVRFSTREDVEPIFRDVEGKIIRNVSAGYITHKIEKLPPDARSEGLPIYRAIDWEPLEISLVPIGADAGAGVRAEQQRTYPCEVIDRTADPAQQPKESTMTEAEKAAQAAAEETRRKEQEAHTRAVAEAADKAKADELARVQGIRELCAAHQLDRAFEDGLIKDQACTLDKARAAVLDKLATKTDGTEIRSGFVETVSDETVNRRAFMVNSIMHRANPSRVKLEEGARPWRNYTLRELMRKCLEIRGIRTEGMSVNEMWQRTYLSGSDLPNVVLDAANKSLRMAYEGTPRTFVPWTRRATAPDFKNINRIQLSGAPSLLEVKSGGEYTRGNVSDGKETYTLVTYGRVIGINRQTIINDDLDAFTRLPELAARAAADLESDTVYGIVTANGTLSDGAALFGTAHANYSTGAATGTIDITTLGIGRQKLRSQTGLEGRKINLRPAFVIVPVAKEGQAEQFTSPNYQAQQGSNINPFAPGGRNPLTPIAEPRLDDNSTAAWYMAADPAQIDTIEYAYLEGEEGVYLESRMGFDVDGIDLKVRLDFAAKAIDFRGLWKAAGA